MKIKLVTLTGKYVTMMNDAHDMIYITNGILTHMNKQYRYDTWIGGDTIQYRETNDYWEKKITGK